MKGLILKDIMNLKKQGIYYLLVIGIYIIISITSGNSFMFQYMICVFGGMLPITAMAYDEKADWDKYALSMPVSRIEMVLSKYVLAIIGLIVGFVFSTVYSLILPAKVEISNRYLMYPYLIVLLFTSIILPILFKVGVEKGRIVMMAILLLPMLSVTLIMTSRVIEPAIKIFIILRDYLPIITAVLVTASILLSHHIYKNKDL